MAKKISVRSADTPDHSYLRKLLWTRFRWPAILWFLAVVVFAWLRDTWTQATPREIALLIFIAGIWFVGILIIPLANYLISAVLSPRRTYEERPCYDLALASMNRGNYLVARHEFLEILEDWPGDRVCYENLIEIYARHLAETDDLDLILKRAQTEVPPSMLKEFKELAVGWQRKALESRNTEKKKLDVDDIYDSELPESLFNRDD